ncbi:MAG TPA: hypothetical protein VFA04_09795 [Bryobacteraceae bacterium]|jgi:hypothetical protein|nr:hypothetical protein [Bryobacteraceae bacterium]
MLKAHTLWSASCRRLNALACCCVLLAGVAVHAQTYVSAEPIPSGTVVGVANLAAIEKLGYRDMAIWSERLLGECRIADKVIDALSNNNAITTVNRVNTRYQVGAGGFEGVTDPSYVFSMIDTGPLAVSPADVFVLDNALGYALNQDGTAQFSLRYNPRDPNDFSIQYAIVTFEGFLSGEQAQDFFQYVGTIDPALFSGSDAGFTQIPVHVFGPENSMLFLIGDVSTSEFETGLYKAAITTPWARYFPLDKNGHPTVATAGAAFPGNDWSAFPDGGQYLAALPNSPRLLAQLAAIRQQHLRAVSNLLTAISKGNVYDYLHNRFRCP